MYGARFMTMIFILLKNTCKQLLVAVLILLFSLSNISAIFFGYLFSNQENLNKTPVAHAAGVKTKTIEFFVGQNQTSGIGVPAGTNWNSVFMVDLPDAITSPTMIKSAWIDYTFQSALTGPPGIVTLGLTPSGFSETVFNSASYQSSGENYTIQVQPDFTAAMQAAMQGPGTKSITFRAFVAGVPRKMENAKMFITYDYDDTAPTQISTIKYRIGQSPGNIAVGGTGITFTSPTMTVTENSPVVVSAWSEIRGQVPATGATDNVFAVNYDADVSSAYYLDNVGGAESQAMYILHPKNSIALNATHTLKIAATAGYQMNLVSAEQVITYKFNYTNSTTLMRTAEMMLGFDGNKASATPLNVTDTINIPEDTPSFKNIYLRGTAHATANSTFGLSAQLGGSIPPPTANFSYTSGGEIMNNFWILSNDINNLGSLVQGDNQLSASFTGTMSSRSAHLIATYSFAKSSLTQSASAAFWTEQQTSYGTSGTPAVTIDIAGAPDAGSLRSFTHANSVHGVTQDRAANISVSPTAPYTHNWDSTGEYQWIVFFNKNSNNEITGNGTYTVNLGSTGSNVIAAVEQISWRYGPIIPSLTSYANSTEAGLNYVVSCTGCGARIGGGAGFRQTIVITGTDFGIDPGVANRSTATNNIKIGTHQIANANVTAWNSVSITIVTDSSVAGDTDTDWGTEFGGVGALTVTAGGQTSTGVNFYIFPQITSITQPVGFPADSAREFDSLDTDGVITLNGTRFGSSQGSGSVAIVGQTSVIDSWTNTAIQSEVSPAIADTTNTGSMVMVQGTGTSNKTHTYGNTFRILPRITGFTPSSASEGGGVTVNGNHFCQGVSCPVSFNANNKVIFTNVVDATVFTSWNATAIVTQVPVGAISGDVTIISNSFISNPFLFSVLSNTPNLPTGLEQWKDALLTKIISVGGTSSSTPIYLSMVVENTGIFGGTLYPQIEYKPIGTAFSCTTATPCVEAVEGNGAGAAPGPIDCGISANNCAITISPADTTYHWQARIRYNKLGVDYFGPWVSFDVNLETETDFKIDTTPPTISSISSGTPGSNSATITWDTSVESSTSRIEYNTSGIFVGGYDCAATNECTTINLILLTSHSVALPNLDSGTTYYYRVRSKDVAGNESISGNNIFTTSSVTQPAKTTQASLFGEPSVITSATTTYFTVLAPETGPTIKSAYIEVMGVVSGGGTIELQANNLGSKTFTIPAGSLTNFKLLYKIADGSFSPSEDILNLNDTLPCTNANPVDPGIQCNKLTIIPSSSSVYITSARFIMTYGFTP